MGVSGDKANRAILSSRELNEVDVTARFTCQKKAPQGLGPCGFY
jgi:hypothetical protein